jgi:F-type H+-transporting ATPase subunit delta
MSDRATVSRQARALLDVSDAAGHAEAVAGELEALAGAFTGDPGVARVLLNPAVPASAKVDAVRALGARLGLTATTAKLLVVLAEHEALDTLPGMARVYQARLLERRNIVAAHVTTATPLPADRADALARRLGEVTGKDVRLSTRVDPSIIGGVVARVGSTVFDGSVTSQLARMRQKLVENV